MAVQRQWGLLAVRLLEMMRELWKDYVSRWNVPANHSSFLNPWRIEILASPVSHARTDRDAGLAWEAGAGRPVVKTKKTRSWVKGLDCPKADAGPKLVGRYSPKPSSYDHDRVEAKDYFSAALQHV